MLSPLVMAIKLRMLLAGTIAEPCSASTVVLVRRENMEYTQDRDGDAESNQSPKLSVRVTGFILAFFALIYLTSMAVYHLQEDQFKGHVLKQTKAVITSVNPGTSKHFLRSYRGYYYHYQFILGHETHTGQFFIRSKKYYEAGHEVDVEYRTDHPEINRRAQSSNHVSNSSMQVMDFFMLVVFGALFIFGAIMFYTGRDIKKPW